MSFKMAFAWVAGSIIGIALITFAVIAFLHDWRIGVIMISVWLGVPLLMLGAAWVVMRLTGGG
jgi:inner membrane protein involved in colicin E2 resistance